MSEDDAKPFRIAADLDGPFVDAKAKGHAVEYLGTEDVDGTLAHKLRVRLKWGGDVTVWIDPDTWMVIRDLQTVMVRGAEQQVETDYGDYEKVGGVYVPMSEESGPRNSPPASRGKSIYEKAEANVGVPADAFAFPANAASRRPEQADESRRPPPRCVGARRRRRPSRRRLRRDLGPRRPQHRLGPDERPHRGSCGPRRGRRKGHAVRRSRLRRSLEVPRRRHDVQARLRQAARPVDRRDRARPVRPEGRVGRDRGELDAQLRVRRGRDLALRRRRRDRGRTWGSRSPSA